MIACLNMPYFAAAVEQRNGTDKLIAVKTRGTATPHAEALVIGGQPWEPLPVYAFSREVARQGVRSGMSLRLAHLLSPGALFLPATPPRYYSASGEITDILTGFTNLVEPEDLWAPVGAKAAGVAARTKTKQRNQLPAHFAGTAFERCLPARYTLDLESLPLEKGLQLALEAGRNVRRSAEFSPAIGLAENKFTAQVAAALTRPNHALPVASAEEGRFLASRSIHFLPLDKETARRLSLLGIRTLGQLASLPMAGLQAQFGLKTTLGQDFARLYHLIQGRSVDMEHSDDALFALRPLVQAKEEQLTHHFEAPVADSLTLERVLKRMAAELASRLQSANLEGRILRLAWKMDGGRADGGNKAALQLSRRSPTADPDKLADSLGELLRQALSLESSTSQGQQESACLGNAVSAISVSMTGLTPSSTVQLTLFGPAQAAIQLEDFLVNITAKHKTAGFLQPVLTNSAHPLPERRFQMNAMATA